MACKTCAWEDENGRTVDGSKSNVAWAQELGLGEASVRRHFSHIDGGRPDASADAGEVGSEESSDGRKSVTAIRDRPVTMEDAREWIRSSGDAPDDYALSIKSIAYGKDLFSNKMSANPKPGRVAVDDDIDPIDPVGILAQLRAQCPTAPFTIDWNGQESAFILTVNDIQLGQGYNGGSPATIANFYRFVQLAKERILDLRKLGRKLGKLVVVVGGDLVEGCMIYANQSFNLDMNRKEQQEGVVALLLHLLDTLAPMFAEVVVLAVYGNHGEHRISGKKTALNDNDDTHCVEMAKLALSRDPKMQHITWHVAEDEAAMSVEVYGWVLMTTHGDIYAKGVSGTTTERKAHAWLKNMAAATRRFGNIGKADVFIGHHFHHDEMADWGDCLWRQTSSQDRGSPGFSQATGTYSEPGMLTGVMMPGHRWRDEEVLR